MTPFAQDRSQGRNDGYGVAEVLICLACLFILASGAVPSWYRLSREWELRSAAQILETSLLWGRMHAITANTSMMLVINAEGRGFYWADPASGAPYHYSTRALPGDVRITSAPRRPLRFYQHGNAVPAGSYVITGDIGAIRIVVNPGGRIRIQRI